MIPLAAAIDDLAASMELQGAADAGGVTDFLDGASVQRQGLVLQLVGRLDAVGREKTVEVALPGYRLIKRERLLALRLCQLQAACLPVAPAIAVGQACGQLASQLVGVVPAAETQEQAGAPFGDVVVAQLRVVLAHDRQGAAVETLGKGQADFAGNRHFLLFGERLARRIQLEQFKGFFRVQARQAAQAQAHHIGHGRIRLAEARGLAEQCWILRYLNQQCALLGAAWQVLHQVAGQAVVARLGGQLGALPAQAFAQLAAGGPAFEQHVAGLRLGFAHQPEFFRGCIGFGCRALTEQVLAVQAIEFGEIEFWVVIIKEGLPFAAFGQPAQPAQFHPAGLRQVAMFGKELLDFAVAGAFQAGGQLVIGQVRLQRVVLQGRGIALVRATVTLGEGAFGFIVILPLLGQVGPVGTVEAEGKGK